MAEALVSVVLEQLASIIGPEIQQEVRQVVGARKEVQKLKRTLQTIQAVLVDAEKRQVKDNYVKDWLEKLKDISYDMDDVFDEWSTAILKLQEGVENAPIPKKVCSYIHSHSFCFSGVFQRCDTARKIKELNERLNEVASEKDRYNFKTIMNTEELERQKTASFVDESEVYGRDQDKKTIVSKLLCGSSQEESSHHIISIVGMGGIGKTTLAQLAYNDNEVKAHFDKRIWVCVSDPFDQIRIAKAIAKALDGSDPSSLDWENLPEHINDSIVKRKFLLVLDDVWTEDFKKWEPLKQSLKNGAQGSRILVTTRKERVAKMMGTTYMHPLGELSIKVCHALFIHIAFFGRSEDDRVKLEGIGRKIADKCKGLPLAAKTLGSLMRFKKTEEEWKNVLDSEIWELEEAEKGLFPALLLSYYDLPPTLKRCFLYCAIFPKDYEIKTEKLIRLWMAQGYLSSRQSKEMEIRGREYFEDLVMRSFFQDVKTDEDDDSIIKCKMHDIVHDFAQFLAKNECFMMEIGDGKEPCMDSSYKTSRHSTIILATGASFPISIYEMENLRTLSIQQPPGLIISIDNALRDLFHHLKCLRALDLSGNSIRELPWEVGNLIHLRYLNLSYNLFRELPKTVWDLCNLQTLDLSFNFYLHKLPKGIGKLINLRHLKTSYLHSLPKEIGRLSSLRTLTEFVLSGGDDRKACKLGDLKNLNNLQESLLIRGLGNVKDVGEAEKAELKCKKHLRGLILDFFAEEAEGKIDGVFEALQPHPNLEFLGIKRCRGTLFPTWIMSLTKLRMLELSGCCMPLPHLGKLPSLKSLEIGSMPSLKKVGLEFLGIGIDDDTTETEASRIIAFPKLKQLIFHSMQELEEWDVTITRGKDEESITIMPCLHSLIIDRCPKLKVLPHYLQTSPIQKLEIISCPILSQRCRKENGEEWAKISHIPNFYIYHY